MASCIYRFGNTRRCPEKKATYPPLTVQVVFEECGLPGGTQMTLMPWAVLGIIFYTVGYPVFIAQVGFMLKTHSK